MAYNFKTKLVKIISVCLTFTMIIGIFSGVVFTTDNAAANTGSIKLYPADDASVEGGSKSGQNFGSSGSLQVKDTSSAYFEGNRKAFIKFDLKDVSTVGSAILHLYIENAPNTQPGVTLKVYGMDSDDWDEDTITWDNAPGNTGVLLDTVTVPPGKNWYELDVTDFIEQSVTEDINKIASLNILLNEKEGAWLGISSKETTTTGNKPYLTITEQEMSEIIIDNADAEFVGDWGVSSSYKKNYYGAGYQSNMVGTGADKAVWRPDISKAGDYSVYYWLPDGMADRSSNAPYTVYFNGGSKTYYVDQTVYPGGQWILLGTHNFAAGTDGYVELADTADGKYVIADAIKFGPPADVPTPTPLPTPPPPGTPWLMSDFGRNNAGNIRIVEFDATPSMDGIDTTIGLSGNDSAPLVKEDFSVAVSFNAEGYIEAKNGDSYSSLESVAYSVYDADSDLNNYHVKIAANLCVKTYDVWVTPSGGAPILIAKDYNFATGAQPLNDIGKLYTITNTAGTFIMGNPRLIANTIMGGEPGAPAFATTKLESDNTGSKVIRFDVTALNNVGNEVMGLAGYNATVTSFGNMPVLFRMYNGFFDAYKGPSSNYSKDNELPAEVGTKYHVKIVPDYSAKTYSVWVAPEGGAPVKIAENYGFRGSAPVTTDSGIMVTNTGDFGQFEISNNLVLDQAELNAAVERLNSATTIEEMKSALISNALGLSLDKYVLMTEEEKNQLATDLLGGIPYENDMAIQAAFEDPTSVREDRDPPSAPGNVTATATDLLQVKITWTAATDDSAVKYYKIFRDGTVIATVNSGTAYVDSWLQPSTTYEYVVKAYDRIPNETASEPVSVTTGTADKVKSFPFTQAVLNEAFEKQLLRYSLTSSNVPIPDSNPPEYYKMYADVGAGGKAFALYYLTVASSYSPEFMSSDGTEIYKRALAHIRNAVTSGNEPGLSGNGLEAIQYLPLLQAINIAKNKVPEIWDSLTAEEKNKIDLIMKAALIGAHWCYSDMNNFATGIDQAGNFGKEWNPNYRQGGVGAAIATALYFGADNANSILKNFDYDAFMGELNSAGLTNIATIFSNTGKTQLEQYTKNDAGDGFTYHGYTLDQLGLWLKDLTNYTFGRTVSPVGGDKVLVSTNYPYGYQGYLVNGYDEFPNLGAEGMGLEFESSDALGKRTSLSYVYFGWQSAIQNLYAVTLFGGEASGLTDAEMSQIINKMGIGTTDMLYKDENGYNGYEKGVYMGTYSLERSGGSAYRSNKELWLNVIDNPLPALQAVNEAANVTDMKSAVESESLSLVLYGYNELSAAGKDAVVQAVLNSRPSEGYFNKAAVQDILYNAVKTEGIKQLNNAETVEELMAAVKSNALGLFIPDFDELTDSQKQLAVQTLLHNKPEDGYTTKKDILTSINYAVKDALQEVQGQLKNLPPVDYNVPRIDVSDYDKWPQNHGDAQVAIWNDNKAGAYSITIDDNYVNEHSLWLDFSREYGVNFTWMAITGDSRFNTEKFAALLAAGQDVQSHTVKHTGLNGRTEQDISDDYSGAIEHINALPGGNAKVIAYPNGVGNTDIASRFYIAGRGVQGYPNQAGLIDYMNVSSCSSNYNSSLTGIENNIKALFDPAGKYYHGWTNAHYHSLTYDIFSSTAQDATPVLRYMLDTLNENSDKIWVGTFAQIAMYGQERDTSKLNVTLRDSKLIKFTLTDLMDDTLFDYPLTVKIRVNNNWNQVTAKQNGEEVPVTVVMNGSDKYVLVKAVPDKGEVELYPSAELMAVNNAATVNDMKTAMAADVLGLDLTEYNALTSENQNKVMQKLIDERPENGYENAAAIQTALDNVIEEVLQPEDPKDPEEPQEPEPGPTPAPTIPEPEPEPGPTPVPTVPAGTVPVDIVEKSQGVVKFKVDEAEINKAIADVKADSNGIKTVVLDFPKVEDATAYIHELPAKLLISNNDGLRLVIPTDIGTVTLPGNMLGKSDVENAETVSIRIGKADTDKLDKTVKNQIGDRPVVELNIQANSRTINWNNPDAAVAIAIPYTPSAKELKKHEHITVWYIDDNGNSTAVPSGRYDPLTGKVSFKTTHFSKYAVTFVNKTFSDVKDSWAREKIEVLASKGIISGTSLTTYSPDRNITRADFLVLLVKTLGLTADVTDNFEDVKVDTYYYNEVGIAKKLGIVEGIGDNRFSPKSAITRQDMLVIVAKALGVSGKLNGDSKISILERFSDGKAANDYAKASIAALVEAGIIAGSNNHLYPRNYTTREEVASLLYTVYNR